MVKKIGHLEKGTGAHQSNLVFLVSGECPTLMAGMGVKMQPIMILEIKKVDENPKD